MQIKSKYFLVLAAVLGVALLFKSNLITESKPSTKPVFFERVPNGFKKAKQHITINIDYEKLPARNEIRLIGRVNAADIHADIIEYTWTLKDNLTLKKGSLKGTINLKDTKEIFLDVAIKNMNKKINVRLEAYTQNTSINIGAARNFTYDPTQESSAESSTFNKISSEELPKEELLRQQLQNARKPSFKQ